MNLLITGATGFIGSRLALHCLERGDKVRILGLKRNEVEAAYLAELESKGAVTHVGSVTEPATLTPAMEGVEVVFHLAAAQHEANVPDQLFRDVNVQGTANMIQAAAESGVRRFVHGSSIGVFGWIPDGTVTEASALEPDNIYGETKLAGEAVVREHVGGPEWTIARISEVYGPGDRRLLKMFKGAQKGRFPMIGKGLNKHHLIYIGDLLEGLLACATSAGAVGKTFVLAGPRAYTSREMLEAITMAVAGPAPKIRLPLGPMLLAATLCEGLLRPLGIQPPLHPRRMNFYRKSFEFSNHEAAAALGFAPRVALDSGAAQTLAWYREQALLD